MEAFVTIETYDDYRAVLETLQARWPADPDENPAAYLVEMVDAVEAYEAGHQQAGKPWP